MKKFRIFVLSRRELVIIFFLFLFLSSVIYFAFAKVPKVVNGAIGEINALSDISNSEASKDNDFSIEDRKLAIIIDDFGSGRQGVEEMMALNRHMTFAVMPFLEYSQADARKAHEMGFEVIVHLPMEPNYGKLSWLGPNPILSGMKSDKVKNIVAESFVNIPYAVGANIHMGSKASSEEGILSAILDVVKEKNMYFVDSRTADHPIGKKISEQKGVTCYERDVFLDGQQPKSFIKKRLSQAEDIAIKKGYAIAAGHVGIEGGKVTAEAISEMLNEFDKNNVRLVYVSELSE